MAASCVQPTAIRGLVVCVGYDDILALTLPTNLNHMLECLVVTSPDDHRTIEYVKQFPKVHLFVTDAFYRHGARFNKGLAIEEAFDFMGRSGWILIWDADILFPESLNVMNCKLGNLYGIDRLQLDDIANFRPQMRWDNLPVSYDKDIPGYFQLFYAADPALESLPWYDPTFNHAGGGDAYFHDKWPQTSKFKLTGQKVLHIGPRDANWYGRATARLDGAKVEGAEVNAADCKAMEVYHGWRKAAGVDTSQHRDRVELPNFKSAYQWNKSPAQVE
jgi:hypothetical protein